MIIQKEGKKKSILSSCREAKHYISININMKNANNRRTVSHLEAANTGMHPMQTYTCRSTIKR